MTQLKFDGGAADALGTNILASLLIVFTFGLGTPWALCMIQEWKAKHTSYDGRRMVFKGSGLGLIGSFIKWWFLTIITFGIYSFWVMPKLIKWTTENTYLVDSNAIELAS